ncbi:DUF6896 domain-containing protein [Streptomyces shenzhenensis]|uniref:DUF6896 domain-containing protein n=1 Tax=Streptomyces shenzhenensis TaxID=943815 RepID=UPI00382EE289
MLARSAAWRTAPVSNSKSLPDLGSILDLIVRRVRAGHLPKDGAVANGIEYSVHGNGCLFVSTDGHEIDVDFHRRWNPCIRFMTGREVLFESGTCVRGHC